MEIGHQKQETLTIFTIQLCVQPCKFIQEDGVLSMYS